MTVHEDALAALDAFAALPEETALDAGEWPQEDGSLEELATVEEWPADEALDRAAAPYDLGAFARVVVPLAKGEPYIDGWFLEELRESLMWFCEEVRARRSPRLMIEAPPRHGKSLHAIELLAAWMLAFALADRRLDIMVISATLEASGDRSSGTRDILRALMATGLVPGLRFSKEAESKWKTTSRGSFYAVGILGTIVSKGAHVLMLDDVVKGREWVLSKTQREKTWRSYTGNIRDRLMPGGGILWMGTRWHKDDAQGRALERSAHEGWRRLTYQAIASKDEAFRNAGEALHDDPMRYPLDALAAIRDTVTEADWAARFQQRPVVEGGAIWQRDWWSYHSEGERPLDLDEGRRWMRTPERFSVIVLAVDLTAGSDTGDGSFGSVQTWGMGGGCAYLLDPTGSERRGQWGFPESEAQILLAIDVAEECYPNTRVVPIIENKALGIAIVRELKRAIKTILIDRAQGSKVARADAAAPHVEKGRAFLPWGARWLPAWLEEVTDFPGGKYDDRVDAASIALRRVTKLGRSLWSQMPD